MGQITKKKESSSSDGKLTAIQGIQKYVPNSLHNGRNPYVKTYQ